MFSQNSIQRKLKKLKAVSFRPANILYDCLAVAAQKIAVVRSVVKRHWAQAKNQRLIDRKFEPMDTAEFVLPGDNIFTQPQQGGELLKEYGICILTDFVDHEVALAAGKEIAGFLTNQEFLEDGKVPLGKDVDGSDKRDYGEDDHFAWQYDYARYDISGYREVQGIDKPFINIRSKKIGVKDAGKIDIFRGQKLASEIGLDNLSKCYEAIRQKSVVSFIEKLSGYREVQANLYYDGGVTTPRGPHLDNNLEQYKIFLYLTDVLDIENGPYCYVPHSHKHRDWMSKERLINSAKDNYLLSTDVGSFPFDGYTKMLAPAGTAIISQQSGIHGAWPQTENGRRALILGNYN